MKKLIAMLAFSFFTGVFAYSQEETTLDLSLYASTVGEVQINIRPKWKFPFLRGENPLTKDNSLVLKLDAAFSPVSAGLTTDVVLTVMPFLSFNFGAMAGTGWNYDLFGKFPLVGLGLNRKTNADDPNDGVMENGLDGVVWNVHAGATVQFDLAAIFPSDWNHVVVQIYNEVQYFAYTKAQGDVLWYYLLDNGMNQNAFRYKFDCFAGYAMPIFVDLAGVQFSGRLPFYNTEAGGRVRDIGYELDIMFLANFKIHERFSIMTLARISNGLTTPITSAYEREWGFDRVQFIATWRVK